MRKIAHALIALLSFLTAAPSFAQVPNFPQTLPPNTVVGRLANTGPAQAIPFARLSQEIALIFGGNVSVGSISIGGDVVLTHPLTPSSAVGLSGTLITLGAGAGASLAPISTTNYLTLLGFYAGHSLTTADHITAVGAFALESYTVRAAIFPNEPSLTAIGIDAMRALTSGGGNTAVGEHTMTANPTINDSTAVGNGAMFNAGGRYNTGVGVSALLGAPAPADYLTGQYNTGVGFATLASLGVGSSTNTAIGSFALNQLFNADNNIGIGYLSCFKNVSGANNICIGSNSGGTVGPVNGSNNILFGANTDTPAAGTNGYLNIGNWLYGDAANFIRAKGSIGTKPPTAFSGVTTGAVGTDDSSIIINASGAFTLTLPAAATYPGRWLNIKNVSAQTISSASANVSPLAGGALGTALLAATAGKWAQLQSNGVYWEIMSGN